VTVAYNSGLIAFPTLRPTQILTLTLAQLRKCTIYLTLTLLNICWRKHPGWWWWCHIDGHRCLLLWLWVGYLDLHCCKVHIKVLQLLRIVLALQSVVCLFGSRGIFHLLFLHTYSILAHQRRQKQDNSPQHSYSQPVSRQRDGEKCTDRRKRPQRVKTPRRR